MADTNSAEAPSFVEGPLGPFALPVLNGPSGEAVSTAWRDRGGFVLHGVVPPDVCDSVVEALNAHIIAADAADKAQPWPTAFGDRLIASGSSVVPFWDPTVAADLPPTERLMRLGHQLQQLPEVGQVLRRPEIVGCIGVLLKSPQLVNCVLIDKVPGGTVQFSSHQDSWYLLSEPDTLISLQIALDDTDEENGCLHVQGKAERDPVTCRAVLGRTGWKTTRETQPPPPDADVPPLPLARGSVLLYHGRVWHGSRVNTSNRHRRIIVAQFKEASSTWLPENWLTAPPGGFPSWR